MIDPRNMPCARVCLPRLSARELPPNAQEQYHNYTVKRKSSMNSLNAGTGTTDISTSSPSPMDFSFVSGVSDQVDRSANNDTNGTSNSTNSSSSSCSCLPIVSSYLETKPVNITSNSFSTKRRNSVASTSSRRSSGSSKSTELIASVCLTPVTWKMPGYTTKPYGHCVPVPELECSEALSDVTDDSRLSEMESTKNFSYCTIRDLTPQDFSHEKVPTSSLSSAMAAYEQLDVDENRSSSGFTSFNDHVLYGCEDMWPDLQSYSPPESPDPQKTETTVFNKFSEEPIKIEDLHVDTQSQPSKSEIPSGFSYSTHSDIKHFLAGQNRLLSPEVKLVPLDGKGYKHNERNTMHPSENTCNRKPFATKGDLLIKIEDVKDKLKPCASGGLTVATNSAGERYTSSGRRIANSYSEKSLARLSVTRALNAQVKKRKVRRKVINPVPHGGTGFVGGAEHQGKKRKRPDRNPAGRKKNSLERYKNLKFSELNTVPRMSMRYKVAFAKWPYVFSGALDLINQRIASQNSFWDSLKS